jgi:hypothetical protein
MIKKQPVRHGVMTNVEVTLGLAPAEMPDIAELNNLTFFNDSICAQRLMNLVGRDGLIFAGTDPRSDGIAQPVLLKLRDDSGNATMLFNQAIHNCGHFGADGATYKTVQKTHVSPLIE